MPTLIDLTDALIAKWSTQSGKELMVEGAKIVDHLLSEGPLPLAAADAMLGQPEGMLGYFSRRHYDLELDADDRIVGAGLSLIPSSPHTMTIDGSAYHGWCMLDCLMFPVILGGTSSVATICPATGTSITLTVTPEGIADLDPATAWFTLAPATGGEIRNVFCRRVNFYRDQAGAETSVAADPDLAAGPATQAWAIAKELAGLF